MSKLSNYRTYQSPCNSLYCSLKARKHAFNNNDNYSLQIVLLSRIYSVSSCKLFLVVGFKFSTTASDDICAQHLENSTPGNIHINISLTRETTIESRFSLEYFSCTLSTFTPAPQIQNWKTVILVLFLFVFHYEISVYSLFAAQSH